MSAKVFGKVWELQIDPIEKLVLLALADHADHEGNNVRPGNKLLCAKTGLSERTIGLKIADFLERGILLPVQTTTGRGNIREFAIDVDAIPRSQYFINREKLKIEAGSTFRPSQRSKQDQPLSEPERLEKVEADNTKVEVDGSAYKEGTVMNLIGDIDIPQTPSLVENPKANFPLANGDNESVHAQQTGSAPIDLSKVVEDGFTKCGLNKLLHIGETKPSTVHANGGIATPPDTPAPPVTEKPQTDHQRMMAALDRVSGGRKILNGAAQGKAIKKILTGYTADQAIECLEWMADPSSWWKGNIDWLSVQNQILSYLTRKEQQPQNKLGGLNTNGRSKLWEFCNSQQLGQF